MMWGQIITFSYLITIHKDVSERLKKINSSLYEEVKKILEINKAQRHIRGGFATKNKYAKEKIKILQR